MGWNHQLVTIYQSWDDHKKVTCAHHENPIFPSKKMALAMEGP